MSKGKRDRSTKARQIVEHQRAAERRRTVTIWTSVAVVVVLFIAGLVGWNMMADQDDGKVTTPTAAVDDGTAFAVGSGPVTVDIYEDFMCPACNSFEQASSATLKQLVDAGKVTVRYHPVAILDRFSNGTEYSTRSAAASAAAAQEGKFTEYHEVLFANQPAEGSDGLSDEKLIELGKSVGLTSDTFADAVNNGSYRSWAAQATEKFSERNFTGTPTITVNGEQLETPSPEQLTQAVEKAAG
ncbi:DsbA family protein [Actinoplanes aureus]|uniref:Thioredoxin domain-containing protein n=1 Tax=Actinoplanes aureus TaxID=2792083 RepID=A0A931C421_9ACTN|nr:thioredoxin domain-containing protein [Actinoplanes aureus]MBG0563030.1 thioredoxin domain-containing protein [Actinoplanes aureus]